ncbi:cell cycle checkpoint control protein RAD9A-like [Anneissia japonica]|uniref:cell cycle checkpoint control protein RAD9A-like n=1 Tax=Anneissia japonica TaxID=1529436 RepID=UPI0014255CA8|nr:cell cycle checkpoint control protein RAD9A-like [Anneissia japonica]
MKCVIPGANVKIFGRAIHCLARIGDELYIEPLEEGLALRTVNTSRSAYACFIFSPNFFSEYNDGCGQYQSNSGDDDAFRCRITMKSCLAVFKSLSSIEKSVERCKIELSIQEARMVFQLYCKHGIVKTYNLTYQETETLQAVFSKDLCPNKIVANSRILSDTVSNFQTSLEEVSLNVTPEVISFKNYVDDEPDPSKVMHTEMSLNPEEFQNYCIGVDTEVTFCLKELRAILSFSDATSLPLSIHFETTGKPIVFCIESEEVVDASFVLATLADPVPSQSSQSYGSQLQSSGRVSTAKSLSKVNRSKGQYSVKRNRGDAGTSTGNKSRHNNLATCDASFPDDDLLHLTTHHAGESTSNWQAESRPIDDIPGSPVIPLTVVPSHSTREQDKEHSNPKNGDGADSEEDEIIPGTPPSKKFKSLFFGSSQVSQSTNQASSQPPPVVLAADTDDEDSD